MRDGEKEETDSIQENRDEGEIKRGKDDREDTERGERETDGVREEGGRGGEGELVTESLTEHISIFLIIPLDESCERERPGAGEMVEEGGRERRREGERDGGKERRIKLQVI